MRKEKNVGPLLKVTQESITIALGAKHRIINETDEPLVFVEVQTGESFEEEDIIRIEDDYGREDS